jgi:hypothetical protein
VSSGEECSLFPPDWPQFSACHYLITPSLILGLKEITTTSGTTFSAFTLALKIFLLLRKGQFGEKRENRLQFSSFFLNVPLVQKAISYHPLQNNKTSKNEGGG